MDVFFNVEMGIFPSLGGRTFAKIFCSKDLMMNNQDKSKFAFTENGRIAFGLC